MSIGSISHSSLYTGIISWNNGSDVLLSARIWLPSAFLLVQPVVGSIVWVLLWLIKPRSREMSARNYGLGMLSAPNFFFISFLSLPIYWLNLGDQFIISHGHAWYHGPPTFWMRTIVGTISLDSSNMGTVSFDVLIRSVVGTWVTRKNMIVFVSTKKSIEGGAVSNKYGKLHVPCELATWSFIFCIYHVAIPVSLIYFSFYLPFNFS